MNNPTILFWTPYNRAKWSYTHKDRSRPHPTLDPRWLEVRFEIWRRYCLQSMQNQTHEDWHAIVCCDPDSRDIMQPMFDRIKDKRIFIGYENAKANREFLADIGKNDNVITIRLDSDDMYHPEALRAVLDGKFREWAIFKKGYAVRTETPKKHMWHYDVFGSGPFFAHRYYRNFQKENMLEPSHGTIKAQNPTVLPHGLFMVNITGMNSSTHPRIKNFRHKIFHPEKQEILDSFKIDFWSEPIKPA